MRGNAVTHEMRLNIYVYVLFLRGRYVRVNDKAVRRARSERKPAQPAGSGRK